MTGQKILKSLQQGEDLEFDQIMNVLGCVAEHCLSSLFDALFTWYNHKLKNLKPQEASTNENSKTSSSLKSHGKSGVSPANDSVSTRQTAVKIVMCLTLI